ncbi:glycosyltransferase family 1 protein [Acinetobacter schindleri]|uniref:Glycosyltransferase family 1 protein n=1 Tax=Acinetobacter schindleri TaxID=108981 RepID=A0AAE7BVD5_9GAMM|nr:glycosyltransferase family 1 protein [Acinetobacter schindleri]QIC65935.1 glycosyltransferase family 1 protein [Acinetobacter schindleri]
MPKKIIHVLGKLDVGGVESWLVSLLKNSLSLKISHNFLVQKKGEGFYDKDVYELGGSIYNCYESNIILYGLKLYKFFKDNKPDVVHSHVHTFTGFILFIAFLAGVKVRVSHSHSDTTAKEKNSSFFRKTYLKIMKFFIKKFSTFKLAVSEKAAVSLYGEKWKEDKNCRLMPCGIETAKYLFISKDDSLREKFNIPEDAFVIGHVGRFEKPKNHNFLIDVFWKAHSKDPNIHLVLVGDGSLKEEIINKVKTLNLENYVHFLGLRKDIPIIMKSIFDIFVFPSLWEGLPLTLIEAQLSGLKCIASNEITNSVDIGLIDFLDISESDLWVNRILLNSKSDKVLKDFYEFSIESNINLLNSVYDVKEA